MSRREQQFRYRLRRQTGMVILTVKVSHPLSALLALASWKVLLNTALSRESWGVGRGCGLRRVSSCFTADGRCLNIFSGESHAGGVDLMTWTLNVERLYSIYSESSSRQNADGPRNDVYPVSLLSRSICGILMDLLMFERSCDRHTY